jgi:preprotein translocase subunit SecG
LIQNQAKSPTPSNNRTRKITNTLQQQTKDRFFFFLIILITYSSKKKKKKQKTELFSPQPNQNPTKNSNNRISIILKREKESAAVETIPVEKNDDGERQERQ